MASVKFTDLPAGAAVLATDVYAAVETGGDVSQKYTITQLQTFLAAQYFPLSMANGGSAKALTASVGGIVWTDANSMEVLAGTATANQVLLSGSSATPAWSTATYPATTTINQLLYSSSANVIAGLASANNGILITSAGGVPSIGSTIPAAVQGNITATGTIATGTWNGTVIGSTYGGTGVNNGASTITVGGNVTFSGGFTTTLTVGANTSVTLPSAGTITNTINVLNNSMSYAVDAGAADAYSVTLSPAAASYVAGMQVIMKAANANTGPSTINVNGLGVQNIKLASAADPAANDILANGVYILIYDGTNFQLINPS